MCKFMMNNTLCKNQHKSKYGGYCFKHRRNHLINNCLICYKNFTNKGSDYLKNDIIITLESFKNKKINKSIKKQVLFNELLDHYNMSKKFNNDNDIKSIITIQKLIKKKLSNYSFLRGKGYFNKDICNNTEDFFSFENINDLNQKYFFSYEDVNKFIWFFDIRSFNKLIELNQSNPYTREPLPKNIIEKANILTNKLKLNELDEQIDIHLIKQTKKQIVKQKTVDLFSSIEQCGYECNITWFLNLNREKLKRLYRNLEDLWNYRLPLTPQIKSRIAPPNGLVFTTRVNDIWNMSVKEDIQSIILNEVSKFNNANLESDKKLGYMYFLIGLGMVSKECYDSHQWLMLANG